MPQDLTTPTWYNDDAYIKDKVAECNVIRFGDKSDWTADSVKAALASAFGEETYASWMGYQNFVSNGNAENCSPSPYFVVAEYLAAKAAQLNEIKYEDKTDWDQAKVLDSFKAANISAWDHYTKYGQAEGLNPSNAFDTSEFLDAKCKVLNAWDDGAGFEGKTDWTPEDVVAVFQGLNINPIMNQPDNPDAASLVIAVPADEQVNGGSFNPWTPAAPTEYNDIPLVAGEHEFNGTEGNDNFIGDVSGSASKSTLQRDDVIDGKGGDDMLTVGLAGNWAGFSSKGGMTGVETINLNNTTGRSYNFDTSGIQGAETYNVKGAVNLTDLAAPGITVNLTDVHATNGITLGFAKGATSGPSDALTIGLENVYVPSRNSDQPNKAVDIKAAGIEDVTINSTGKTLNQVNLDDVSYMSSLVVTGDGDLEVEANGTDLTKIDGSEATGDIDVFVNTNGRATSPQITSAVFGSGDDTLTTNVAYNATIDGGDGNDAVIIAGAAGGYALSTNSLEEVGIESNTGNVTLIGSEMDGVETLSLSNTQNGPNGKGIVLGEFSNTQLNVQAENLNTANLTIADISDISVRVGDGLRSTNDRFFGNLTLDASSLSISADDGVEQGAVFNGEVDADDVMDLELHAGRNSFITVQNGSDLSSVSNITASGYGTVTIDDGSSLSTEAQSVYVDTRQMTNGQFNAVFNANSEGADMDILGGNLTDHNIYVGPGYSSISVETGMGNDNLTLVANNNGSNFTQTTLEGNLGGGINTVEVRGTDLSKADFSALNGVTQFVFQKGSNWELANLGDFNPIVNQNVIILNGGVGGTTNIDIPTNATSWTVPIPAGATSITVNGENAENLNSIYVPTSSTPVIMNNITPAGNTFRIDSGSDSTFTTPEFSSLSSLTLNTTNEDASVSLAGRDNPLSSLTYLELSGDGTIFVDPLIGKTGWTDMGPALKVDATGMTKGSDLQSARFNVEKLTYTGGDGDESMQVWLNNTDNVIKLGKGSDTAIIQTGTHTVASDVKFATGSIYLGDDTETDTISIQSPGGFDDNNDSQPDYRNSGTKLTIDEFKAGIDKLQIQVLQADDGSDYLSGTFMDKWGGTGNAANIALLLNNFDLGLQAGDITGVGTNVVYTEKAAYIVYLDGAVKMDGTAFGTATTFNGTNADLKGVTLIELLGVTDTTLTSVEAINAGTGA